MIAHWSSMHSWTVVKRLMIPQDRVSFFAERVYEEDGVGIASHLSALLQKE